MAILHDQDLSLAIGVTSARAFLVGRRLPESQVCALGGLLTSRNCVNFHLPAEARSGSSSCGFPHFGSHSQPEDCTARNVAWVVNAHMDAAVAH